MSKKFKIETPKADKYKSDIDKFHEEAKVEGNLISIDSGNFFYHEVKEGLTQEFFNDVLTPETNRKVEAGVIGIQEAAVEFFDKNPDEERAYFDIRLGSDKQRMTGSVDRVVRGSMKNKEGNEEPWESHLMVKMGIANYASGEGISAIKKAGKEAYRKHLGLED